MARINIEDDLWSDDRFLSLVEKLGNRASAIGAVVIAFKLAQKYWIPDQRPIPSVQFRSIPFASELTSCGLAIEDEKQESVYIRGSENQFDWLIQRSRAGSKSKGKKVNGTERNLTGANGTKPLTPSPSLPPAPAPSLALPPALFSKGSSDANASPPVVKSQAGLFISNYISFYQDRYGAKARPALTGKVQGQIKRFLAETPIERACSLIEAYLKMNDQWFITKAHDFGTFIENLSKIGLALDTGKTTSRKEAVQSEEKDFHRNQANRLLGGKS